MGWGFRGKCAACRHEWEGISTSALVGPWIPGMDVSMYLVFFSHWRCPRCALGLSIRRSIDRNSWRNWLETDAAGEQGRFPYLDGIVEKLDQAIGSGKPDVPIIVEFHPGDCPECHEPFEKSEKEEENPRLVCPECRNPDAVIDQNGGHYNVYFSDHGFR